MERLRPPCPRTRGPPWTGFGWARAPVTSGNRSTSQRIAVCKVPDAAYAMRQTPTVTNPRPPLPVGLGLFCHRALAWATTVSTRDTTQCACAAPPDPRHIPHGSVLQLRAISVRGHAAPPCAASLVTARDFVCVPPPHVALHSLHGPHLPTSQSRGQSHIRSDSLSGSQGGCSCPASS